MPRFRFKTPVFSRLCGFCQLFPLDGTSWFWSEIVEHTVYAFDFRGNACGDVLQEFKWNIFYSCSHGINSIYCANDNTPFISTLVVAYTYALEIRNSSEVLPYFAFKAVLCKFFTKNRIRFTHCFQTVAGNSAQATHAQTRAWEWLTIYHAVRKTQCFPAFAYFVLKEHFEWFYQFKVEVFRKATNVVVRFYAFHGLGTGFDDVRINGPLTEEFNAFELACFFFEYTNEFSANDFTFLFRIRHISQFAKEAVYSIYINEVCLHFITEYLNNLFRFAFTKQAMVYVYAGQLIADGTNQECCNNRGVYTTGQCQQDFFVANLTTDKFYLVSDEVFHVPVCFSTTSIKYKCRNSCLACFFVCRPSFCALMINFNHWQATLTNIVTNVNFNTVNNAVYPAVNNNPLDVWKCF